MKEMAFHYKQKNFTCGPAALRIAIQTLIEHDISEELLTELLGTNEEIGTPLFVFEANLTELLAKICLLQNIPNNFESTIKQNSTIDELSALEIDGYCIILNYTKPDDQPHWAALKSINSKVITLMDPDFGPNYQYQIEQFNWKGGSKTRPTNRAFIAIRYRNS